MLRGEKVALRARIESDVPVLQAELYNDVITHSRADTRAWRPLSPNSTASPFRISEPTDNFDAFSIVEPADDAGELAGEAVLWGIDQHNRSAHLGLALRPAFRGRGLAVDTLRILCDYGYALRGLQRLSIETLSDNEAMVRSAERVGFVREGVLRRAAWVNGEFLDVTLFGMLADEWRQARSRGSRSLESDARELSRADDIVDEAGRESFPASDPPAF